MMKEKQNISMITAIVLGLVIALGMLGSIFPIPCMAAEEKKADLSAISGFGKGYTQDEKGKFEIEGVMVTHGSMYNVTVDGECIQSWCGERKGRFWDGEPLIDLLNDPTTLFYGKAEGTKKSTEYSDPVEFARPNGKSF